MKLRSKLLMAAVSLLTVSVAATATSAYAWYAANRQTNASLSEVSVRSTETSIAVTLVKDPGEAASDTKSPGFTHTGTGTGIASGNDAFGIKTEQKVSEVSGIGIGTFVKPYLDAKGTSVVGWHNQDSVKANFYKFTLKFVATGGDKAVNLYFSGNSEIKTGGTGSPADLSIPSAARLSAVVNGVQKLVYLPSGVEKHIYTDGKKSGEPSSDYTGALTSLPTKEAGTGLDFKQGTPDLRTNPEDSVATCSGKLGTVTPGDEEGLDVTFYLWVEGTATSLGNTNTIATASLTSNLEFYTI